MGDSTIPHVDLALEDEVNAYLEVEEAELGKIETSLPALGSWLPFGMHDSAHDLADAHAKALALTRKHRQEARIAEEYPQDMEVFIRDILGMELTDNQREIVKQVEQGTRRIAIKSCHGSGKGLALDTPLPTPDGWTSMGQVRVGDELIDEAGQPCRVVYVSPIRNLDCYRVTLDDGSCLICDKDHLWTVLDFSDKTRLRARLTSRGCKVVDWRDHWDAGQTIDTPTLANKVHTSWGQRSLSIPLPQPLDLPSRTLPVPPYVFGVWLGDGDTGAPAITTADVEVLNELRVEGWEATRWPASTSSGLASHYGIRPLGGKGAPTLRETGALGRKHIPDEYLRASREQRLALLQGLMDTDGWVHRQGTACIALTNEDLIHDVEELVRSLGWRTTVTSLQRPYGDRFVTRYNLSFAPDTVVFRLPRKRAQQKFTVVQRTRQTHRMIVAVDPVESVSTRCIQVDSPRSLFLAGRGLIPTHNTRVLAAIVIAFLHINKFSKVVTTGPGGTQLKEGLWQDIRYLASQSTRKLITEPLTTKWELAPGWFALGYKPSENKAARLQGIHAPKMLLVVDEAAEVENEIYGALASLMTSEQCVIVMIGNPTKREGPFYRAFTSAATIWHRITIKAEDTPNVQAGCEVFPGLITREWISDTIAEHGEDSDYVRSRVNAEFPLQGDTSFIPVDLMEAAHRRRFEQEDMPDRYEGGVDVARFGNDKTVVTIRNHGKPVLQEAWGKLDTMETVGRIKSIAERYPPMRWKIDVIGLGAGVADRMREEGFDVLDVTVSAKSFYPDQFLSVRDELWWTFRQMLVDGYICGPIPDEVQAQCTSIRFKYDSRHTKPVIESKSDMKARDLGSPDEAESFLLAFVEPQGKPKKKKVAAAPVAIEHGRGWIDHDALGPEPSTWGDPWTMP